MITQAQHQLRTIRDVLRFSISYFQKHALFFGHGIQTAWDEAVYLILHTLHLPRTQLDAFLDARLTEDELTALLAVVQRRVLERRPAAYLTGEAWLGDYRFMIDERVIVPRSFISELLFEELSPWIDKPHKVRRVLDLCTGSGCLAIIAADIFPNAQVDALDLSPQALQVAQHNIDTYQRNDRIRCIQSDLFEHLTDQRYDLILSNPPYVNTASMAALPAEYRHEPQLALAGGADGLDIVRRIIANAAHYLTEPGLLIVEIGHERAHLEVAFPDLACTWLTTSAGDDMVFLVTRDQLPSS